MVRRATVTTDLSVDSAPEQPVAMCLLDEVSSVIGHRLPGEVGVVHRKLNRPPAALGAVGGFAGWLLGACWPPSRMALTGSPTPGVMPGLVQPTKSPPIAMVMAAVSRTRLR